MLTKFEEYAASSMLGHPDSPPRSHGKFLFDRPWERQIFGMALSLSKAGCFEWEDFRQNLIEEIARWEDGRCPGQPRWDYYERFLAAFEKTVLEAGILGAFDIDAIMGQSFIKQEERSC
jgi:nitrile hydratase accessory protein